MKILLIAHRRDRPREDFEPWFDPEAKKVLQFMAEDFFREVYSRADGKGAVMIVEAPGVETVEERLKELPFVQNGLLDFEIYPLVPYRGIVEAANS